MTYDDLSRPPFDRDALTVALTRGATLWREVEVLPESRSTNAWLAELARAGGAEGQVVVTHHQTAGRGRLDRSWVTPAGAALTFSVLLTPDRVPAARWPWLPLLTGIAVAEGIRRATGVESSLKWPNDVLVGERKIAGILVERVETPTGPVAVVGVGVNVTTRADELPVATATSLLLEDATTVDRTVVLREVLRTLEALYLQWRAEDGDASRGLHASYVRRCATIGRTVRVALPDGTEAVGTAETVDGEGRLVVVGDRGTIVLGAGDVVHATQVPEPGT